MEKHLTHTDALLYKQETTYLPLKSPACLQILHQRQ